MPASISAARMRGPNDALAETPSSASVWIAEDGGEGFASEGDGSSKPKPRTGSSGVWLDDRGGVGVERRTDRGGRAAGVTRGDSLKSGKSNDAVIGRAGAATASPATEASWR